MDNGISVYSGLNCSLDENLQLLETAASLGLRRLFTSILIPEAENIQTEFAEVLAAAVESDFEIIIDVTPETISDFDFALDFEQVIPRLDDGFNLRQIATLSRIRRIMLNASTVEEELLATLMELDADFSNISALHNFYPRIHTGLDNNYFRHQNCLLKSFGITVGAFAPTLDGRRRPPLSEGLPTVELTRNFNVDLTARYLTALGADFVIISDSLPTLEECASLANITAEEVILEARRLTDDAASLKLLSQRFHCRTEISPAVIRTADSRVFTKELGSNIIPDGNPQPRDCGFITIDNSNFGRYMGEVQIVKSSLSPDPRTNAVAQITAENLPLLDALTPGKAFTLRFI